MAYLDEIAAILEGSSQPLYPLSSGSYWVSMETTDTGLYFQETASSGLFELSTAVFPTGFVGLQVRAVRRVPILAGEGT